MAMVVLLAGVLLRTREVVWLGNGPLLWAHLMFHLGNLGGERLRWTAPAGLALIGVTLGVGLLAWGRRRAADDETRASEALIPYALAGTLAGIALAVTRCPERLEVAVLAGEAVLLVLAGLWLREPILRWLAVLPLAWAHGVWFQHHKALPLHQSLILVAATLGSGLLLWARERNDESEPERAARAESVLWPFGLAVVAVALVTTFDVVPRAYRLPVLAGQGAVLVLSGMPVLRPLGLAPFMLGTLGFLAVSRYRLGGATVAWLSLLLGWLLMVLSARVLRLRAVEGDTTGWRLRATIVALATVVLLSGLQKLVAATTLTVGWAAGGFLLLALGFGVRERMYRVAGLVVLACGVARAILYDLPKVEAIYRILSFIALGGILLLLAYLYTKNRDRVAKWL